MRNRSPLQVDKNKAFKTTHAIKQKLPVGSIVNCFPFYDGNIELELANSSRFVVGHTEKYCVYEFWRCAMVDPEQVASVVSYLTPFNEPKAFNIYQDNLEKYRDPFARAGIFFVLNQLSDSGMVSSGKLAKEEVSSINISNLKRFSGENFHINFVKDDIYDEHLKNIEKTEKILINCGIYHENLLTEGRSVGPEETIIDHKKVFNFFKNTSTQTLLLYRPTKSLLRLYKDYEIEMYTKNGIRTSNVEDCAEVLIANF